MDKMKKVMVEIFFVNKNFSAHIPILPGCISVGDTPEEIKKNIKEAIQFHIKGMKKDGDELPALFKKGYELIYKFDAQSVMKYYKNVITGTALEKYSGINQKQLNHYANSYRKPKQLQIKKIKEAFHKLGSELLAIKM